jgi:hypothetical protein
MELAFISVEVRLLLFFFFNIADYLKKLRISKKTKETVAIRNKIPVVVRPAVIKFSWPSVNSNLSAKAAIGPSAAGAAVA